MIEIAVIVGLAWLLWPRGGAGAGGGGGGTIPPPITVTLGELNPKPIEVLQPLVSATPRPGRFYQIVANGPNAAGNNGLLAQALNFYAPGKGSSGSLRLAYLDEMTKGWNVDLYSRDQPSTNWPPLYNFRGVNLGPAWLPRNANAVAEIVAGRMPKRTITSSGNLIAGVPGSMHGFLWLPDIDEDALKAGAVVVRQRDDGSDPFMPPRELLDLLTG